MQTATKQYQITRGRTTIEVPHNNNNITFVYEKYGPDTYAGVAESIEKADLARPTMAETASLVHQAFLNDKEPEFDNIRETMENRWLWAFTRSRYFPNKGAFIYPEKDHERFGN